MMKLRTTLGGAAVVGIVAASPRAFADCYVDSQAGNDSNSGASEAEAVQSQAALGSGCGTVYFKRGSVFNEPLSTGAGSTFTNYGEASDPLPAFITTDTVVNSFQGGITIDGLHLEGSTGDGSMSGVGGGTCVMLGGDSQLLNSEITQCDIGMMTFGDNVVVRGNVIYDLDRMAVDSEDTTVYANSVGGAEGIFVSGSNTEIAYNSFINCKAEADWQGEGGYDGGATEVAVGEGETVSGLKVHHNFSYNNCGFFEVSGFGTFADSEFYYNVSIDSAWAMLLQVNETTLSNIRWENNTFVHHADAYTPSIAMVYQAELTPNTVFFNNNLVIFDGANSFMATLDDAMSASNNLIVESDPGVVNLGGITAADFDLVEGSQAIDQGMAIAGRTLDYLNRAVPAGAATDIGAFEYGAEQGEEAPETPEVPNETDTGAEGTGGAADTGTETATGGQTPEEPTGTAAAGAPTTTTTDTGDTTTTTGTGDTTTATPTATDDGQLECPTGYTLCGDVCFDLASNANNCGACGNACPAGQLCSGGQCTAAATCQAPLVLCGEVCVDTSTDPSNCGSCGAACAAGQVCSMGTCSSGCAASLTQCGQACVDLNSDVLNCGTCGAACQGGQSCVNGQCQGTPTGGTLTEPTATTASNAVVVEDDGGCGCSVPGSHRSRWAAVLGALVGLVALGGRRRRT